MKKSIYTTLALIVLSMTMLTITRNASGVVQYWGVEPTDNYIYNLNQVNIIYDIPPTSYNSSSITFGNMSLIPQNSSIQLNITNVQTLNVTYELFTNDLSETHFINNETYETQIYELLFLPLRFANKEIALNEIKRGFTGLDYLLVPKSETTWDTFDGYDNPLFVALTQEIFNELADVYIEAETETDQTNDNCIFEWFVNGTYFDDEVAVDFVFTYNLIIAYDMSTGLLLGMRVDLSIEGYKQEENLVIAIQSEVEREDFDLADFTLPKGDGINLDDFLSSLFPGYEWWFVPIIGFTLSSIGIIRRKRRR